MFIKAWNWISNLATAWGLLPSSVATYITAALWMAAMAIAGHVESIPVFWVMMGLPLAAAAIFTFVLRASELRERHRVKDKIVFAAPRVAQKIGADGHVVEAIALGFQLQNHAPYAIDFELVSLETNLGELYPPKKPYSKTRYSVPPHGSAWFDDHLIPIATPPRKEAMKGKVHFEIRYGVGEKLRHSIKKDLDVFVGFDEKGGFDGSNWQES